MPSLRPGGVRRCDRDHKFLRASGKNILLNCSRQAGKSTTTAIIAFHTAVYRPNAELDPGFCAVVVNQQALAGNRREADIRTEVLIVR